MEAAISIENTGKHVTRKMEAAAVIEFICLAIYGATYAAIGMWSRRKYPRNVMDEVYFYGAAERAKK